MQTFNKLVRDKIPELLVQGGRRCTTRILTNDKEYHQALLAKVLEEAQEVYAANGDNDKLATEIGDLIEVIDALVSNVGLSQEKIDNLRTARKEKRGGFDQRIFLESIN